MRFHQEWNAEQGGWDNVAEPGYTEIKLPYGGDQFVHDANADEIQAEIDAQASADPKNYMRLWALIDADAKQNPDSSHGVPETPEEKQ